MVSEIRTNKISSRAGLSTVRLTDTGPVFSGIATFSDTVQADFNNVNAIGIVTASSFSGDGSALTGIQQGVPGVSTTGTSHFNSLNAEFDINEKDSSILENLSEKKDNCNKHLTNAIHHFEDCLFKLGYDLSDIETSDWEEGN